MRILGILIALLIVAYLILSQRQTVMHESSPGVVTEAPQPPRVPQRQEDVPQFQEDMHDFMQDAERQRRERLKAMER